jgi:hypothetical protein
MTFIGHSLTFSTAILNSLQFAAHLHGSLIIMSLSAMLLHFIHRGLSSKHGVPLGFLTSGFQLNSLSYIFCKEFRSIDLRYIGIFFGAFALAMLSGPSSAIIMIPRLQFWTMDNIWIGPGNVNFSVYIQANESSLYPNTLTADNAPPQCLQSNASLLSECPAYGMRRWLMIEEELFNVGYASFNKTIEDGWVRYMVGQSPPVFVGTQSSYIATTLSNFLGSALMSFSTLLESIDPDVMDSANGPTSIQSTESVLARYDLSFRSAGNQIASRKPLVCGPLVIFYYCLDVSGVVVLNTSGQPLRAISLAYELCFKENINSEFGTHRLRLNAQAIQQMRHPSSCLMICFSGHPHRTLPIHNGASQHRIFRTFQ